MKSFNETITTGTITSWVRSNAIVINNPMGGVPSITFYQERIKKMPDGETLSIKEGELQVIADDMTKKFKLLNPQTGEDLLAEMSYSDLVVAIFSLYTEQVLKQVAPVISE